MRPTGPISPTSLARYELPSPFSLTSPLCPMSRTPPRPSDAIWEGSGGLSPRFLQGPMEVVVGLSR
eukprot:2282251-Pyramimonas_sp.AAC.1